MRKLLLSGASVALLSLGAASLSRFYELNWARREKGNRVVTFSPKGTARFNALFGSVE